MNLEALIAKGWTRTNPLTRAQELNYFRVRNLLNAVPDKDFRRIKLSVRPLESGENISKFQKSVAISE